MEKEDEPKMTYWQQMMLLDENYKYDNHDEADFDDVKKIVESPAMENCSIYSEEDRNK